MIKRFPKKKKKSFYFVEIVGVVRRFG